MSEPHQPPEGTGESGDAAPQTPAPPGQSTLSLTLRRLRGRAGWGLGLAGTLVAVALVATGPFWAPLLPWADGTEPAPDPGTARVEAPQPPRQPEVVAPNPAVQELDRRVAALEARPAAPLHDLAEISQEVARLAASSAALATRIETIDKTVRGQTAGDPTDIALVLALLQIRDAIEIGRPFAAAYEALVALARSRPEIVAAAAPLAAPATTGLAGRPVLADRLRELAGAVAKENASASAPASTGAAAPDWTDEAWRRLNGLVTIRRIDGAAQGDADGGPSAALHAASRALAGGDLEGAIGALENLTGAPAETIRPWLRMAKERLAAEAALHKIEALLMARLGAPANPQAGSGPSR
jgi:hypothetical protein